MTCVNWAQQTAGILFRYQFIPNLRHEEGWRDWGNYVSNIPALAAVNAPGTTGFKTWQDWARRFNDCVRLLGI